MARLIRVSKSKEDPRIPIAPSTLYKWRHMGRHPEIFVSFSSRALFVDLDRLDQLIEKSRVTTPRA